VSFGALDLKIMEQIVDKFLVELNQQLSPKKVRLSLSDPAREWLARKGHDPKFGARPLSRLIQTEIKDKLSDQILFGELAKGGDVRVDLSEDRLTFSW
jgi:ATP-dependent Clp protease ATP-binding subunit ClpA